LNGGSRTNLSTRVYGFASLVLLRPLGKVFQADDDDDDDDDGDDDVQENNVTYRN
jgi:hypothetical protein